MVTPYKNILITGVAGFIGSNLADRLLAEGRKVIGIDNLAYGIKEQIPSRVRFHKVDIRDKKLGSLFEGADVVFHLAAKNCIADCQNDPVETSDINVTGTVNVLEACRKAGVKKVILAESSAIYEGTKIFPTPETEQAPESFYARSKLALKLFCDAYTRFHGLRVTALRYFCVYGPRQDYRRTIPPVMSAFILKLLKGEKPVIYGDGSKRRDFIHVDDVNDFHLLCLNDGKTDGKTFNLGSGKNYSVEEICALVQKLLKTNISPEYKPDLPGESLNTLADISKARALGWRPRVSLEEGLQSSVVYIRKHVLDAS